VKKREYLRRSIDTFIYRAVAHLNVLFIVRSVVDERAGECMDPEGNGINSWEGDGGSGPPSEEQDKQLISNSGGGEIPMGQARRQEDESDAISRTHHAQSTYWCE
jgi:hypothetical protein